MDQYINLYISANISDPIYDYMGWNELRKYDGVPERVWKRICEYFCEDCIFEANFKKYWNNHIDIAYRERILLYLSSLILRFDKTDIAPVLLKDRNFVLFASKSDWQGSILKNCPFKSDLEIVLRAIKCNCISYMYTDPSLKYDREFVLKAVKLDGLVLQYVPDSMKSDIEIVSTATQNNPRAFDHANQNIKENCDSIISILNVASSDILSYVPHHLYSDQEFMLEALQANSSAFRYVPESLRTNNEFILKAIHLNGDIFKQIYYPSISLKLDPRFSSIALEYMDKIAFC